MTNTRTFCFYIGSATSLLLCLMPANLHSKSFLTNAETRYSVSSRGFSIGEITSTQLATEEDGIVNIHFESRSRVSASFLWMAYRLETTEKGTIRNGELMSYSRKGNENGATIDIEGRLDHAFFQFYIHGPGAPRTVAVPKSSYDYTTMECPEAWIDFSNQPKVTLRILDVEKMAVVRREYRLIRSSHYSIADMVFPCRIVDFSDQNKSARRWIALDGSAVVMFRQDGNSGKNSYSVQATSLTKDIR